MPGLISFFGGGRAPRFGVGFPGTATFFPPQKAVCTGSPVRWSSASLSSLEQPQSVSFTLFILGGSAGARRLNRTLPQALALLHASHQEIRIIHQTGQAEQAEVAALYEQLGLSAEVVAFIYKMLAVYTPAYL